MGNDSDGFFVVGLASAMVCASSDGFDEGSCCGDNLLPSSMVRAGLGGFVANLDGFDERCCLLGDNVFPSSRFFRLLDRT